MSSESSRRSAIYDPAYRYMLAQLKAARRAIGLTQEEVSNRLRKSPNFVSRCESGERRIDPIDLMRFALVYKRDITSLLPKSVSIDG